MIIEQVEDFQVEQIRNCWWQNWNQWKINLTQQSPGHTWLGGHTSMCIESNTTQGEIIPTTYFIVAQSQTSQLIQFHYKEREKLKK